MPGRHAVAAAGVGMLLAALVGCAPSTPSTPATGTGGGAGTALAALDTLPVKGRAPKTGYHRDQFGEAWLDADHNGCDTRNDILARDLLDERTQGRCRVLSGTLHDPYTGRTVEFRRGAATSAEVQIDHVVALSDAWQTGAQQLSPARRAELANDPLELLAVDGPTNEAKGDGDAATWLPRLKQTRCPYVARQIAVKTRYGLWVTAPEAEAMRRVLSACPGEPVPTSSTPLRVTDGQLAATPTPPPPASDPGAVTPGAFCSPTGARGVTSAGAAMQCSADPGERARWRRA